MPRKLLHAKDQPRDESIRLVRAGALRGRHQAPGEGRRRRRGRTPTSHPHRRRPDAGDRASRSSRGDVVRSRRRLLRHHRWRGLRDRRRPRARPTRGRCVGHSSRGQAGRRGRVAGLERDRRGDGLGCPSGRLALASDRAGYGLCFWMESAGAIFFGSDILSLIRSDPRTSLNEAAVDLFLAGGFISAPWTSLAHVHKVPAGRVLIAYRRAATLTQYWRPTGRPRVRVRGAPLKQLQQQALLKAVERQLPGSGRPALLRRAASIRRTGGAPGRNSPGSPGRVHLSVCRSPWPLQRSGGSAHRRQDAGAGASRDAGPIGRHPVPLATHADRPWRPIQLRRPLGDPARRRRLRRHRRLWSQTLLIAPPPSSSVSAFAPCPSRMRPSPPPSNAHAAPIGAGRVRSPTPNGSPRPAWFGASMPRSRRIPSAARSTSIPAQSSGASGGPRSSLPT